MEKKFSRLIRLLIFMILFYLKYNERISNDKIRIYSKSQFKRVNGCIIVLLRNNDSNKFIVTLKQFEKNFNHKFKYPYVLLSNDIIKNSFKRQIIKNTNSIVEFGQIPNEHWSIPDWINQKLLKKSINTIGFDVNYRLMCRYFSGFFYKHHLTLKYEYYFRIDTDSIFPCEINRDLFRELKQHNKLYGFVLGDNEDLSTITTLWPSIQNWLDHSNYREHHESINNSVEFVAMKNNSKKLYSKCIFYNNFEMASFSMFRNEVYSNFFNYLDKLGGFFYERWGDSPIHTYYAITMMNKSSIHLFTSVYYGHQNVKNYQHSFLFFKYDRCRPLKNKCKNRWLQISNSTLFKN